MCAALALALVVGPLSGVAHRVLIKHVVCTTHGDLVHVSADAAGQTGHAHVEGNDWARDRERNRPDGHNCALPAGLFPTAAMSARESIHELGLPAKTSPSTAVAPRAATVLRYAPKQSPPA